MAITTPQGIDLQAPEPLELKTVKATVADMLAISHITRYEGLRVYVIETQQNYQLKGGIEDINWVLAESSGGHVIQDSGVDLPQRNKLNLIGFNIDDDFDTDSTIVTLIESDPIFTTWINTTPPAYPDDIPTALADLTEDTTHMIVTQAEKDYWNAKVDVELEPIFMASPAYNITSQDFINIQNLSGVNTGDQDLSGYLPVSHLMDYDHALIYTALQIETDPIFTASPAVNLVEQDITNIQNLSGVNTGDQDLSGLLPNSHLMDYDHSLIPTALQEETDPLSLHLNQSTPQTLLNGIPLLEADRIIAQDHELVDKKYVDDAVAGIETYTFSNGLTELAGEVTLGGTLDQSTTVTLSALSDFTLENSTHDTYLYLSPTAFNAVRYSAALQLLGVVNSEEARLSTPDAQLSLMTGVISDLILDRGLQITDTRVGAAAQGLTYVADYSAGFTDRSLVDKAYVDNNAGGNYSFSNGLTDTGGTVTVGGTLTGNTDLITAGNDLNIVSSNNWESYFRVGLSSVYANSFMGFHAENPTGMEYWQIYADQNDIQLTHALNSNTTYSQILVGSQDITLKRRIDSVNYQVQMNSGGLYYAADYSANFGDRNLVDKGYVDTHAGGITEETDPIFSAWLLATPPLYTETDPDFNAWLIATPPLYSETDPHSLHLDQTTPQTISNGVPLLYSGRTINSTYQLVDKKYVDERPLYAGPITTPTVTPTANPGEGTINSISAHVYSTTDGTGIPLLYTIPSATFTFTDGAEELIIINYNGGTPIYQKLVDPSTINGYSIYTVLVVWRQGLTIHSRDEDNYGVALPNKINRSIFNTTPYRRSIYGGLILSETATPTSRTVVVSQAYVYAGVVEENVLAYNSSTDSLVKVTQTNGNWTYTGAQTVYDNTQYNPTTGPVSMGANKYSNRYFYRSIGDVKECFYVMGLGEYNNLPAAQSETVPNVPVLLRDHCVLVGRITIQNGLSSGVVQSAFETTFANSLSINHNDTDNIQGGLSPNFYHSNQPINTTNDVEFNSVRSTVLNSTELQRGVDSKFGTGIPDSEKKKFKLSVTYNAGIITATIQFVSPYTTFYYYINNIKFIVTNSNIAAYTANIAASEGLHFFYINQNTVNADTPVITLTKTPWGISDPDVLLWNFSFNATANEVVWVGHEKHTYGRDIFNHARNHSQGAVYRSGLLLSQYNGITSAQLASNTNNNFGRAMVQIAAGTFFDEDLRNNIAHSDTAITAITPATAETDWDKYVYQFLGFTAIADVGTGPTSIVFPSSRTLISGQPITVMQGNTTTVRGTTTITTGGTGTTFTVSSVTGLAAGDAIVVGGRIPIYYISSVAGSTYTWRKLTATEFLGVSGGAAITTANIGSATCQYNNAVSGGFTAMTANRYYPIYLLATNFTNEPVIAILGQGQSTNSTLNTALGEAPFQFSNLLGLGNLEIQEVVPFYRLAFHYNTTAGFNQNRMRLVNATFIDIRVTTTSASVVAPSASSDHATLSNRQWDLAGHTSGQIVPKTAGFDAGGLPVVYDLVVPYFDATIGAGGDYADIDAAQTAGKYRLLGVGTITVSTNTTLTNAIYLDLNGQTLACGNYIITKGTGGSLAITCNKTIGNITFTYDSGKALFNSFTLATLRIFNIGTITNSSTANGTTISSNGYFSNLAVVIPNRTYGGFGINTLAFTGTVNDVLMTINAANSTPIYSTDVNNTKFTNLVLSGTGFSLMLIGNAENIVSTCTGQLWLYNGLHIIHSSGTLSCTGKIVDFACKALTSISGKMIDGSVNDAYGITNNNGQTFIDVTFSSTFTITNSYNIIVSKCRITGALTLQTSSYNCTITGNVLTAGLTDTTGVTSNVIQGNR